MEMNNGIKNRLKSFALHYNLKSNNRRTAFFALSNNEKFEVFGEVGVFSKRFLVDSRC